MSGDRGVAALVLAAGQGKRMGSEVAKVLLPLAGRPLVLHVLDALRPLGPQPVLVVIGHQREKVAAALAGAGCQTVVQDEQLGTGHAVQVAAAALGDFDRTLLVLAGDAPLLRTETLRALLAEHRGHRAAATVLSARVPDPSGYGRIIRGPDGDLESIVEQRDARDDQLSIDEINSAMYAFEYPELREMLGRLARDNAQGEYYLTDTIALLRRSGRRVRAMCAPDYREVLGINTPEQLAEAEAFYAEIHGSQGRKP
jgi:bifunctional UDP-N-acetylglucosamine pyrophosphorylase/glucosamine-1-phosphate N-acetyltransferase